MMECHELMLLICLLVNSITIKWFFISSILLLRHPITYLLTTIYFLSYGVPWTIADILFKRYVMMLDVIRWNGAFSQTQFIKSNVI